MAGPLDVTLIDALLGLKLASTDQVAGNRFSIEGLTVGATAGGSTGFGIRKLEAASLRLSAGAHVLEVGRAVLNEVAAQMRMDAGAPRLSALNAADAELTGVKLHGPVVLPSKPAPGSWSLGPLAAMGGTIRAQIVDAHLLFDADVKVPITQGQVRFNDASVEHVGPDSRMGVSRMGIYVDAPNGRSYLYQFPSAPVDGVVYEHRGALLGPFVSDRGSLQLQPFVESLLRQGASGRGPGFTEQSKLLFDRTSIAGDLQLGDGKIVMPGLQAEVAGRTEGRNAVHLHSEAVGRGVNADLPSLSIRNAVLDANGMQLACDQLAGSVTLRLFVEREQLQFLLELPAVKLSGLRLTPVAGVLPPAAAPAASPSPAGSPLPTRSPA